MGNILRDFRRTIYTLRKKYSFNLDLYRTSETIDFDTGHKITTRTKYSILKGILLPSAVYRDYNYANQLTGTNQYGGIIDTTTRRIIIDKRQLSIILNVNDYFVFNHNRYAIKEITEMEVVDYLSIIVKQIIGQPPFESYDLNYVDFIDLDEQINGAELIDPVVVTPVAYHQIIDPYNLSLEYGNYET